MKKRDKSPVLDYSKAELLDKKLILTMLRHHDVEFYPLHNARDEYEAKIRVRSPSPVDKKTLLKDKSVRKNIDDLMTLMNMSTDSRLGLPLNSTLKHKDMLIDSNRAPTLRDDYFDTEESIHGVEEEGRNLTNLKIIYTGGLLEDDSRKASNTQIAPYQSVQSNPDNEFLGQGAAYFSIDSRGLPRFEESVEKKSSRKSSRSPQGTNESIIEAIFNKARLSQLGSPKGIDTLSVDQLKEIKTLIEEKIQEKSMSIDPNTSKGDNAFGSTQESIERSGLLSGSKQEVEQPSLEESRRHDTNEPQPLHIPTLMGQIQIDEEQESQRESVKTPSLGKGGSEAQLADAKQLIDTLQTEEMKNFRLQDLNSFAGSRRESFSTPTVMRSEEENMLSHQFKEYESKESARSGPKSNKSDHSLPPSALSEVQTRSRGESKNSFTSRGLETERGKSSDEEKANIKKRSPSPIGSFKSLKFSPRDESSDSARGIYKSEGGISRKVRKPQFNSAKHSSKKSLKSEEKEKGEAYVPSIPLELLENVLKDEPEEIVEEKPKSKRDEVTHEELNRDFTRRTTDSRSDTKRKKEKEELSQLEPEEVKQVENEGPVQIESHNGHVTITKQLFERLMPEMSYKDFLTILFKSKKNQERPRIGELSKSPKRKIESIHDPNSSFLSDFHYEDPAFKTIPTGYLVKHWTPRSNSPDSFRFSPKGVQSAKTMKNKNRFPSPLEEKRQPVLEEVKEVVDSSHNSVNPSEAVKVFSSGNRESPKKRYMQAKNSPPKKLKIINISYESSTYGMPEMSYEEEEESLGKLRTLSKDNLLSKKKIDSLIEHGKKAASSVKKLGDAERQFKQKYFVTMGYTDEVTPTERKKNYNYVHPKEAFKAKKLEEIALIAKKKNALKTYTEVSKQNVSKELESVEKLQDSLRASSPIRKLKFEEMNTKDIMKYHKSAIQRAKMMQVDYVRNHKHKEKFSKYIVDKQEGYCFSSKEDL